MEDNAARLKLEYWPINNVNEAREFELWVSGLDGLTLIDDRSFIPPPDYVFILTGSKSYDTIVGGTNTVVAAEVVPLAKLKPFERLFMIDRSDWDWHTSGAQLLGTGCAVNY